MSINKRKIGNTDLGISELGMGTAPIGGWPIEVNENEAFVTLDRAWKRGIRYFDTAPLYGSGMAEHRLGKFLKNIKSKTGRNVPHTLSKATNIFISEEKNIVIVRESSSNRL